VVGAEEDAQRFRDELAREEHDDAEVDGDAKRRRRGARGEEGNERRERLGRQGFIDPWIKNGFARGPRPGLLHSEKINGQDC
jgi:hypothetical protein